MVLLNLLPHREQARWRQRRHWHGMLGVALGVAVLAMLLYIVGRSQQITSFEILSFILVLAAIVLIKRGWSALATLWFPFFFMLFMVPLPGPLVSMVTMPMKMDFLYLKLIPIKRQSLK